MTQEPDKVALFDVDEVLLDIWQPLIDTYNRFFNTHLTSRSFPAIVRDFDKNREKYKDFSLYFMQSETFGRLKARPGMKQLLHQMREKQYDLVVITASSPDPRLAAKRQQNLETEFGSIFKSIHCTGSPDKTAIIQQYARQYRLSLFIDDHPDTVAQSVGIVNAPIWQANAVRAPYFARIRKPMFVAKKATDILTIAAQMEHSR